jgi:O-antigen/teichoic acid export membrane protein
LVESVAATGLISHLPAFKLMHYINSCLSMSLKKLTYTFSPSLMHPIFRRIEASRVISRLANGVFWSMAGSVISRGLMLCATVLVARMLGKTAYGEFGMIQSTIGMFGVFAGFGLGLTATKHVAEFRQADPHRTGRIIAISGLFAMGTGGLMALGLLIFAPWLAECTINAPHLIGALRVGALILFINALNGAQTGALAGFEAFKTIACVNLVIGLISFPILIGGVYLGGLIGAVWALAINLCFNWLLNHVALRQEARRYNIPFTFKNCRQELPLLWSFALPATLSGIMVGPANWACRALLTNQPNGYDEIGILTAVLVFQGLLLFVAEMMSAPLLSMISNAGVNISEKLGIINMLSTWILGVIAAIPLLCFPELAQLVFGSSYATRSFKLTYSLVIFCSAIMMFKQGLARVLVANNLLWWGVFSNTLWAVILIGSSAYLVRWGSSGLAASLTIAYILNTVTLLPLYYARKLVPEGTLLSRESGLIWMILAILVFLNFFDVSVGYRMVAFGPCLLITGFAFKRIAFPGVVTAEHDNR